jgi:hypothetical protein
MVNLNYWKSLQTDQVTTVIDKTGDEFFRRGLVSLSSYELGVLNNL